MRQTTKPPRRACGTKTGKYRSKFESRVADNLESRGVAFEYEAGSVNYVLPPKRYIPDFRVKALGFYVEVKGWFKGCDRTKLLAVKKANPDLDLRLLFQRAKSPINKGSKTTYSMWAEANGFPWAEGTVPESWLKP